MRDPIEAYENQYLNEMYGDEKIEEATTGNRNTEVFCTDDEISEMRAVASFHQRMRELVQGLPSNKPNSINEKGEAI